MGLTDDAAFSYDYAQAIVDDVLRRSPELAAQSALLTLSAVALEKAGGRPAFADEMGTRWSSPAPAVVARALAHIVFSFEAQSRGDVYQRVGNNFHAAHEFFTAAWSLAPAGAETRWRTLADAFPAKLRV